MCHCNCHWEYADGTCRLNNPKKGDCEPDQYDEESLEDLSIIPRGLERIELAIDNINRI